MSEVKNALTAAKPDEPPYCEACGDPLDENGWCETCYEVEMGIEDDLDEEPEDDELLDETCPICCASYDEIDYEYQICPYCGHNNKPKR